MSISQGTTVGIQGIGGYLNLRSSHKSRDQSTINVNKERHQNNLKEMLVKKFFSKLSSNCKASSDSIASIKKTYSKACDMDFWIIIKSQKWALIRSRF